MEKIPLKVEEQKRLDSIQEAYEKKKKNTYYHLEIINEINEVVNDVFDDTEMYLDSYIDEDIDDAFMAKWSHKCGHEILSLYFTQKRKDLFLCIPTKTAIIHAVNSICGIHDLKYGEVFDDEEEEEENDQD